MELVGVGSDRFLGPLREGRSGGRRGSLGSSRPASHSSHSHVHSHSHSHVRHAIHFLGALTCKLASTRSPGLGLGIDRHIGIELPNHFHLGWQCDYLVTSIAFGMQHMAFVTGQHGGEQRRSANQSERRV